MGLRLWAIILLVVSAVVLVASTASIGTYWVVAKMSFPDLDGAKFEKDISLWKVRTEANVPDVINESDDVSWENTTDPTDEPWCFKQKDGPKKGDIRDRIRSSEGLMVISILLALVMCILALLAVFRKVPSMLGFAVLTILTSLCLLSGMSVFASIYHACDKNYCDMLYDALTAIGMGELDHKYQCGPNAGMGLAIVALLFAVFGAIPAAFCVHRSTKKESDGSYTAVLGA